MFCVFLDVGDDFSDINMIFDIGIVLGGKDVIVGKEFGGFFIMLNDVGIGGVSFLLEFKLRKKFY